MTEERRQFERFEGREGAFAAFIHSNELVDIGRIVDMSSGGLVSGI